MKHITTPEEYKRYQKRVDDFLTREGIQHLTPVIDPDTDEWVEPYFSWYACECCNRDLGGDRYTCSAYHEESSQILEYKICVDCLYYLEYGKLDDMTMMEIGLD